MSHVPPSCHRRARYHRRLEGRTNRGVSARPTHGSSITFVMVNRLDARVCTVFGLLVVVRGEGPEIAMDFAGAASTTPPGGPLPLEHPASPGPERSTGVPDPRRPDGREAGRARFGARWVRADLGGLLPAQRADRGHPPRRGGQPRPRIARVPRRARDRPAPPGDRAALPGRRSFRRPQFAAVLPAQGFPLRARHRYAAVVLVTSAHAVTAAAPAPSRGDGRSGSARRRWPSTGTLASWPPRGRPRVHPRGSRLQPPAIPPPRSTRPSPRRSPRPLPVVAPFTPTEVFSGYCFYESTVPMPTTSRSPPYGNDGGRGRPLPFARGDRPYRLTSRATDAAARVPHGRLLPHRRGRRAPARRSRATAGRRVPAYRARARGGARLRGGVRGGHLRRRPTAACAT